MFSPNKHPFIRNVYGIETHIPSPSDLEGKSVITQKVKNKTTVAVYAR